MHVACDWHVVAILHDSVMTLPDLLYKHFFFLLDLNVSNNLESFASVSRQGSCALCTGSQLLKGNEFADVI